MLELGQCYRVPPSPNCYQVTPVHYGSAADVNKKDTQDGESLKTSYYSEFRVQGWKNAQPLQTATHFSSDESWVWTFKCLHNIIALNDVRQPHRARKNALSRCALKKRKKDQVKRENEKGGGDCIMSESFRLVRNLFLHALASLKYTRPQLRCPVRNIPLITLLTS